MASVPTHQPRACRMQCYRERKVSRRVTTDHVMPLLPQAQQMVLPPAPVRPVLPERSVTMVTNLTASIHPMNDVCARARRALIVSPRVF